MSLEHYLEVRDGKRLPRFMQARSLRGPDLGISLLDSKIERAERLLDSCDLCPHHCLVNRNEGKVGYCGVANQAAVHWEGVLHGEEIELVPSHEVFFSGCTMRCAFCYSHEHITHAMSGQVVSPQELAACASARRSEGAHNLNLVGGEPTVHLAHILKTLRELQVPQPVVWNSNMYATPAAMELLDGVVDLFLGDIHFGNDQCAQTLGKIPDYFDSVTRALLLAHASGASLIIRHLLMPGHLQCCARPAMQWAKEHLPAVPFHLMFQYRPDFRALGDPVLGRLLTAEEMESAREMAREIGVCLYAESSAQSLLDNEKNEAFVAIGEDVDVLIHDDGRISFTRLTGELLPVAAALGDNVRLASRLTMPLEN